MNATTNNPITHWMGGIAYEVAFWNNVYRWPWTFRGMMGWSNYGSDINLEGFDAVAFLAQKDNPKVLDVGCGMSYATGDHITVDGRQKPIDIDYVDPLAHCFNHILRRYDRHLPDITFGMAEYLSAFYPEKSVSLVIIQNALDHSSDPMKGIMEALEVLEPAGVLYLNHHPNEAETEHYKGFHQFNICEECGKLIVWNKHCRFDVAELTRNIAQTEVRKMPNGHVIAVLHKIEGGQRTP